MVAVVHDGRPGDAALAALAIARAVLVLGLGVRAVIPVPRRLEPPLDRHPLRLDRLAHPSHAIVVNGPAPATAALLGARVVVAGDGAHSAAGLSGQVIVAPSTGQLDALCRAVRAGPGPPFKLTGRWAFPPGEDRDGRARAGRLRLLAWADRPRPAGRLASWVRALGDFARSDPSLDVTFAGPFAWRGWPLARLRQAARDCPGRVRWWTRPVGSLALGGLCVNHDAFVDLSSGPGFGAAAALALSRGLVCLLTCRPPFPDWFTDCPFARVLPREDRGDVATAAASLEEFLTSGRPVWEAQAELAGSGWAQSSWSSFVLAWSLALAVEPPEVL